MFQTTNQSSTDLGHEAPHDAASSHSLQKTLGGNLALEQGWKGMGVPETRVPHKWLVYNDHSI